MIEAQTRSFVTAGATLLLIAAALFLAWQAVDAIVIIMVGAVMAVALRAAADGLARIAPVSRNWALALVILILVAATVGGIWFGGSALAGQLQAYLKAVQEVARSFQDFVSRGAGGLLPEGKIDISDEMPKFATIFGNAARLFGALSELAIDVIIIAFLAVFFAWQPEVYRSALVTLTPPEQRSRTASALDRAASTVRKWIAGQAVSMIVVFTATLIALLVAGMPYAILLALMSGLLTFVPTIGPFIAGVAITIAGLSVSPAMGLYGFGIYLLIQFVETYMVTPIVQNEAVHLPPAATLGAQLVGGAVLGGLGFAFAVPLAAAARALVLDLYVEPMEDAARGSLPA